MNHQLWKKFKAGKEVTVTFLDIWQTGLLHKLKSAGNKSNSANMVNRLFIRSLPKRNVGVPHGSVLSPLLFLVFINDFINEVYFCNVHLYANDTWIFLQVDNHEETAVIINDNLQKIDSWTNYWLIIFSAPKTKVLAISIKCDAHRNPPII